jgi:hypothetical protein
VKVIPKSHARSGRDPDDLPPLPAPAKNRERRTQQLVAAAEKLIEERIHKGIASPTEVVAIIRLGTEMERANIERIRMHTEYLQAQKAKAESETVREELFTRAMQAMSRYQGRDEDNENVQ